MGLSVIFSTLHTSLICFITNHTMGMTKSALSIAMHDQTKIAGSVNPVVTTFYFTEKDVNKPFEMMIAVESHLLEPVLWKVQTLF